MFSPRGLSSLLIASLMLLLAADSVSAQQTSRAAQLRAAQGRGSRIAPLPAQPYRAAQRVASPGRSQMVAAPIARLAQGSGPGVPLEATGTPTLSAPLVGSSGAVDIYNGPISEGAVISGGSPVVGDGYFPAAQTPTEVYQGVSGSCMSGGCNRGCSGCVGGAAMMPNVGMPMPYAAPNCYYPLGQCLFRGLGLITRNIDLFGGAQGFRSRNFFAGDQLIDDSSFGLYGGFNMTLPLQPITFGLISGQVGVRSVQSEFDGDMFSGDNREQLFITAALFRKVDYGLQFGVAFDFLYEEWFAESDLAQIRGDLGWACQQDCVFGFRFATGTQDHLTSGIINGVAFDDLLVDVVDNYRFYFRRPAGRGFCDLFTGWSEDEHALFGMDFDMPVSNCCAMQSGFTYFLSGDEIENDPIVSRDAWNVYVGFSLRPRGVGWYRRSGPMFNVADNGTFVQRR